jgi:S-(hydroxymethyl)glutathione dehydrogenase / alcohol dehydrogenase
MRAAVLHAPGDPALEVRDDVATTDVAPGTVRVKIKATGVCHSDLSAMLGNLPQPSPLVPGHEGAGEVVEVGDGVTSVAPGDHVIICWVPPCGTCSYCIGGQPNLCMTGTIDSFVNPRFLVGDKPFYGMSGTGTFAEELVVLASAAQKIPNDVPFDIASLIGCGVTTGVGAAINTAKVRPGSSVVVFGAGGVGISVIQGARIAGAAELVAVDVAPTKLDWAKQFGASHAVTPDDLPALSQELTAGQGFDYAFEVVGRSEVIRAAYDNTRRGGVCTIVGAGRADDIVSFNALELFAQEKTILGTIYGSADVRRDYDRLIRLWRTGRLDLDRMISRKITLDDINDAFDAMTKGEVIRQVIEFA